MGRVFHVNARVRELLLACALPLVVFVICRSLAASWYAVDLSGIPDEGQVPVSLLPWFLYSYDSGGGPFSDAMRARTWLVSCAGYFIPPFLAAFAARRTSTRLCAMILLGGFIVWSTVAIPAPPGHAAYYTATTVTYGRLWIMALALLGAGLGILANQIRARSRG
jgi:hypothetical protein